MRVLPTDNNNDPTTPQVIDNDDAPWSSDPANADKETYEEPTPVNPRDRRCWVPRSATGEELPRASK